MKAQTGQAVFPLRTESTGWEGHGVPDPLLHGCFVKHLCRFAQTVAFVLSETPPHFEISEKVFLHIIQTLFHHFTL